MSSDYYFYTEALLDGTWYGVDPRVLRLERGEQGMTWEIIPTYHNGSRSYFGETFSKLDEVSMPIKLDETSAEFRMSRIMDWCGDDKEIGPYYDKCLRMVPLERIQSLMPNRTDHDFHGLYHKDKIMMFESDDLESLYEDDISPEAYSALDAEAKKLYQYYEWNSPMSWRHYLPIILNKIELRVDDFESVNYCECENIRVIMYECY